MIKWWTPERDATLRALHGTMLIIEVANALGTTRGAVRARITALGIRKRDDAWTADELAVLRAAYDGLEYSEDLDIAAIARTLGRTFTAVTLKASRLKLTDIARKGVRVRKDAPQYETQAERNAAVGLATKQRIAEKGHPRGMAGKHHTPEVKAHLAATGRAHWRGLSQTQRVAHAQKALKTKIEKYGAVNTATSRGSWKAGWREIGDKRKYYRSRWEANYARYLEWLRAQGQIKDWQHEPETFWFDGIKRGVRSYLPDFRVWEADGSSVLHEVKGWMDSRSKTTLRRMAKYHPSETVIVIREKQYNEIARKIGPMIVDWESGGRSDRP